MLVSPHSADGDARESGASRPNQEIVLRAALRSALESVRSVCDELFAQLASARRESIAEAAAASERIVGIQAEAELAVQRAVSRSGSRPSSSDAKSSGSAIR